MNLNLAMIRAQFDAVFRGECTREAASNWAREMREMIERDGLTITPEVHRRQIWEALVFLEGYDMKNSPTEYLYGPEDLIANMP